MDDSVDDLDEHLVRVTRGEWVYEVSAVKRCEPLLDLDALDLEGLVVLVVVVVLWALLFHWWWPTWKLGVVRRPPADVTGGSRVVHKERLPREVDLDAEVARVRAAVEAGAFDGFRRSRWRPTTYRSSARAAQAG